MEQALADLKAAYTALTDKVTAMQAPAPVVDHTADVQAATAAVNTALATLNSKFPS